jgi:hypothetical protein
MKNFMTARRNIVGFMTINYYVLCKSCYDENLYVHSQELLGGTNRLLSFDTTSDASNVCLHCRGNMFSESGFRS